MTFWESFYVAAVLASAISTIALLAWFFWDVFWRQPRDERRGATPRATRREIVALQWKRRQALRRLGSRWVLHPNQPPVNWGYKHD